MQPSEVDGGVYGIGPHLYRARSTISKHLARFFSRGPALIAMRARQPE